MFSLRNVLGLAGVGGLALAALAVGFAQNPGKQPPKQPAKGNVGTEVIVEFPTNGPMETAWKVNWATTRGYGLYIRDAWFKKSPNDEWMQVLGDARLSEMFVPYHKGNPRYWDVAYDFPLCTVTKDDAGPSGKLLSPGQGKTPTVVQEIRDRGIIWLDNRARRGQKLVLFGTLLAANYRYIVEFGFCDDGTINFRCGSTGHNLGGHESQPHMHNALWRVDVNLDGPNNNSVYVMEHIEPDNGKKDQARTDHTPFNEGKEGFLDWNAEKFTMLKVVHETKKNQKGDPLAYEVMSMRMGNARHASGAKLEKVKGVKFPKEECTQHDFWVTRAKPEEIRYYELPHYIADGEPVLDTDIVLWHSTPMHHEPRSEDGAFIDGAFRGCTHVGWSGFDLRPRNLFDRTPLYPYAKPKPKD